MTSFLASQHYSEADVEPVAKAILLAKSKVPASLSGLDHKYGRKEYCHVSDEDLGADLFARRSATPSKTLSDNPPSGNPPKKTQGLKQTKLDPKATKPRSTKKKAAAHTVLSDAPSNASRPPRSRAPNKKQAREEALARARVWAEARRSSDAAIAK